MISNPKEMDVVRYNLILLNVKNFIKKKIYNIKINVWNIRTDPPSIYYTPEKLKIRNLAYEKFILEQL